MAEDLKSYLKIDERVVASFFQRPLPAQFTTLGPALDLAITSLRWNPVGLAMLLTIGRRKEELAT